MLYLSIASPAAQPCLDHASMCHEFKDGMDCQAANAEVNTEMCWCKVVDNKWVYCGCSKALEISKKEYIEYLIYSGKKNEVEI